LATLRKAIDERYSYRDRLGLDWDKLFASARPSLLAADSPKAFAEGLALLLKPAKDVHIWLEVEGQGRVATTLPPRANFDRKGATSIVTDGHAVGACVSAGHASKTIGYINIASFVREDCRDLAASFGSALGAFNEVKSLIIDVRLNSGGDETIAMQVAGRFVATGLVYAQNEPRDPSAQSGFAPAYKRTLAPVAPRIALPVAVLMGPANMSSCEAFLLMMRAAGAKLIGERSLGASGNPQPFKLGNGVTVYLPSWRAMFAAGAYSEGVGIAPDIEVKATAQDLAKGDPVIEAAQKALSK